VFRFFGAKPGAAPVSPSIDRRTSGGSSSGVVYGAQHPPVKPTVYGAQHPPASVPPIVVTAPKLSAAAAPLSTRPPSPRPEPRRNSADASVLKASAPAVGGTAAMTAAVDDDSFGPSSSTVEELDRKLKVLLYCVEEKTDDNDSLWRRIHSLQEETCRKLAQPVQVLPEDLVHVDPSNAQASDNAVQQALLRSFERRIAELSDLLDQLAADNVHLQDQWSVLIGAKNANSLVSGNSTRERAGTASSSATPAPAPAVVAAAPAAAASAANATTGSAESTVTEAAAGGANDEELKVLRFSLKRKERLVVQLEARISKQRDAKRALAEDNAQYESRLVALQSEMEMALEKEAGRRRDAERALQKLRKRVIDIEKKVKEGRRKSKKSAGDDKVRSKSTEPKDGDEGSASASSGGASSSSSSSGGGGSNSNSNSNSNSSSEKSASDEASTSSDRSGDVGSSSESGGESDSSEDSDEDGDSESKDKATAVVASVVEIE
jgi:hypothetical protein